MDLSGASSHDFIGTPLGSTTSTGHLDPYEGLRLFTFSGLTNRGDTMVLYQIGTAGLGTTELVLSGWYANETLGSPADTGEAALRIFGDAAESRVLASATTGMMQAASSLTWKPFDLSVGLIGQTNYASVLKGLEDRLALLGSVQHLVEPCHHLPERLDVQAHQIEAVGLVDVEDVAVRIEESVSVRVDVDVVADG